MPKVVSLFCGAGGMDLGFIQAGFKVIWANDFRKDACETYSKNIGKHIVCGDINSIQMSEIPECDLIIGGPPCQGFSVAGRMDPNDPRSQLIWSFYNVVVAKRPRYFVMENVRSLGKLAKFELVRQSLLTHFIEAGYNVRFEILNSAHYDVPQARERFILIGTTDSYDDIVFPERNKATISVRDAIGDLPPPGEGINQGVCRAKITVAQYPVRRRSPFAGMIFNGLGRPLDLDRPACTLPASMGGNKTPIVEQNVLRDPESHSWVKEHHRLVMSGKDFDAFTIEVPNYIRRLTVCECARLQGFPDDFKFCGSQSQQYSQIGNAVPPPLAKHIAKSLMASIRRTAKPRRMSQRNLPLFLSPVSVAAGSR